MPRGSLSDVSAIKHDLPNCNVSTYPQVFTADFGNGDIHQLLTSEHWVWSSKVKMIAIGERDVEGGVEEEGGGSDDLRPGSQTEE